LVWSLKDTVVLEAYDGSASSNKLTSINDLTDISVVRHLR